MFKLFKVCFHKYKYVGGRTGDGITLFFRHRCSKCGKEKWF